jgi:hypothetical protein
LNTGIWDELWDADFGLPFSDGGGAGEEESGSKTLTDFRLRASPSSLLLECDTGILLLGDAGGRWGERDVAVAVAGSVTGDPLVSSFEGRP